jgi:hypothetical protein
VSWSKRLLDIDLELATSPKERIAARERHWLLTKKWEADVEAKSRAGNADSPRDLVDQVKYSRLEAEIGYLKEKSKTTR